jgi:hypothetical protein
VHVHLVWQNVKRAAKNEIEDYLGIEGMATEGDGLLQGDNADEKGQERGGGASTATPGTAAATASRVEVSAQTIARMMGIASATDLQLLEGRLDLLASRVSTLMMKVDKVIASLGTLATTGDIGRLETQIASMKSILREAVESIGVAQEGTKSGDREVGEAQSRRLKGGIQSSSD